VYVVVVAERSNLWRCIHDSGLTFRDGDVPRVGKYQLSMSTLGTAAKAALWRLFDLI